MAWLLPEWDIAHKNTDMILSRNREIGKVVHDDPPEYAGISLSCGKNSEEAQDSPC